MGEPEPRDAECTGSLVVTRSRVRQTCGPPAIKRVSQTKMPALAPFGILEELCEAQIRGIQVWCPVPILQGGTIRSPGALQKGKTAHGTHGIRGLALHHVDVGPFLSPAAAPHIAHDPRHAHNYLHTACRASLPPGSLPRGTILPAPAHSLLPSSLCSAHLQVGCSTLTLSS